MIAEFSKALSTIFIRLRTLCGSAWLSGDGGFVVMSSQAKQPVKEAAEWVARGALLLDVRTWDEYASKHLPGAQNIPVQELIARRAELGPSPREIVVYCRSGVRSAAAATFLRAGGHRVFDLGAMENWPIS